MGIISQDFTLLYTKVLTPPNLTRLGFDSIPTKTHRRFFVPCSTQKCPDGHFASSWRTGNRSLSWIFCSHFVLQNISLPRPPLAAVLAFVLLRLRASPRLGSIPRRSGNVVKPQRIHVGVKLHYAGGQGIEPRFFGPKPNVLPLDDPPIYCGSN